MSKCGTIKEDLKNPHNCSNCKSSILKDMMTGCVNKHNIIVSMKDRVPLTTLLPDQNSLNAITFFPNKQI